MSISGRVRALETTEYALMMAGNGAPALFAGESTLYWDYTNDDLYVNEDGLNGWQLIGGGGGPGFPHALLSLTHSDATPQAVSRGSLVYGDNAPSWNELTHPGANRILTTDANDVLWSTYSLIGTAGQTYTFGTVGGTISTSPGTLTVATANATTAAGVHTHTITSSSNPGAAASILASDANGYLQLVSLGIGGLPWGDQVIYMTSGASTMPVLEIENTNADSLAPVLMFYKNTVSPAANDDLGAIDFYGETSTGAQERYAYILAESLDVTNTDTAGNLRFQVVMDATERSFLELRGYNGSVNEGEIVFNDGGQDVDFIIEAAGNANAFNMLGSDGRIGIGRAVSDLYTIDVEPAYPEAEAIMIRRYGAGTGNADRWGLGIANSTNTDIASLLATSTTYTTGGIFAAWLGNSMLGLYQGAMEFRIGYGVAAPPTMVFTTTKLVAVRNTTPMVPLHPSSGAASDAPTLGSPTGGFAVSNADTDYGFQVGVISTGKSWVQSGRMDSTATAYDLLLQPGGGAVGVGASTCVARLHVNEDGGYCDALIQSGIADATYSEANLYFKTITGTTDTLKKVALIAERDASYSWARSDFHIAVDGAADSGSAGVSDAKLTILYGGYVGLNTTAPIEHLHMKYLSSTVDIVLLIEGVVDDPYDSFPILRFAIPGDMAKIQWYADGLYFGSVTSLAGAGFTEKFRIEASEVVSSVSFAAGSSSDPVISDGNGIQVNGKILRITTSKTPASSAAAGNAGEICWDSSYIYVCIAANTWRRFGPGAAF